MHAYYIPTTKTIYPAYNHMFANAISCTEFKRDEELRFSGYINEEKALVEAAGMAYISIPLKLQFQTDYELDHHLHTAEIERLVATFGLCMCVRGGWREERGQDERIRWILLI
jgi:hypothetical protein